MSKYLIKLKPIDKFYFGSIDSFGKNNKKDYVLFSNQFPQQTSVLGMLRKEILIQKELIKEDGNYSDEEKKEIEEFIGGKSFDIENENNFGKIKSISSMYIAKEDNFFMSTPKNHMIYKKNGKNKNSDREKNKKYSPFKIEESKNIIKNNSSEIVALDGYKAKDGLVNNFMNIKNGNIKEFSDIYIEITDIGINKSVDKKAFFKKMKYKFKKGYSFAFNADIDFELKSSIVKVGDKSSFFEMKVEKIEEKIISKIEIDKIKTEENGDYIIFLSDGIIDLKDLKYKFGIIDNVKFKNWKTETCNYKFEKNEVIYNLVKRGSVLYCGDNKKEIEEKIKENKNYKKIGFNEIY